MAEIVSMPGVTIPEQPAEQQPCPEVIETLEDLLARARRGEIQAVAVALVESDGSTNYQWGFATVGRRHVMFAAIADLSHEFAAARSEARRWRVPISDPA